MVGLLGFAASFTAIGLALVGLNPEGKMTGFALTAFVLSGILFIVAVVAFCELCRYMFVRSKQQKQIGNYMREAYVLRKRLLISKAPTVDSEALAETSQWVANVQEWLDKNLPEQAPDFGLDTIHVTNESFYYREVAVAVSNTALLIENRTSNLREILRETRK